MAIAERLQAITTLSEIKLNVCLLIILLGLKSLGERNRRSRRPDPMRQTNGYLRHIITRYYAQRGLSANMHEFTISAFLKFLTTDAPLTSSELEEVVFMTETIFCIQSIGEVRFANNDYENFLEYRSEIRRMYEAEGRYFDVVLKDF
jgi:hypothetical protein